MNSDFETGKAGQLFEDFLKEQGTYENTTEQALKRVARAVGHIQNAKSGLDAP